MLLTFRVNIVCDQIAAILHHGVFVLWANASTVALVTHLVGLGDQGQSGRCQSCSVAFHREVTRRHACVRIKLSV